VIALGSCDLHGHQLQRPAQVVLGDLVRQGGLGGGGGLDRSGHRPLGPCHRDGFVQVAGDFGRRRLVSSHQLQGIGDPGVQAGPAQAGGVAVEGVADELV
jgi:hypothetical protein